MQIYHLCPPLNRSLVRTQRARFLFCQAGTQVLARWRESSMGPLNNEEFIMVTALHGCFWTLNGENDHGNSWTLIQMISTVRMDLVLPYGMLTHGITRSQSGNAHTICSHGEPWWAHDPKLHNPHQSTFRICNAMAWSYHVLPKPKQCPVQVNPTNCNRCVPRS